MNKHDLWHTNYSTFKKLIKQPSINKKKAIDIIKEAFPSISYSVNRFINVKGNKSPFDGDILYWAKRNSKYYDGRLRRQKRSKQVITNVNTATIIYITRKRSNCIM
jgi:hypothetical protein